MTNLDYDYNFDDEDQWEILFELPSEEDVEPAHGLTNEAIEMASFMIYQDRLNDR